MKVLRDGGYAPFAAQGQHAVLNLKDASYFDLQKTDKIQSTQCENDSLLQAKALIGTADHVDDEIVGNAAVQESGGNVATVTTARAIGPGGVLVEVDVDEGAIRPGRFSLCRGGSLVKMVTVMKVLRDGGYAP